MQVSHVADNITHAVVGGKKQIDFSISDDASFFHILSSTLYTNQRLAVVREVLCNAWDAHIASGVTTKPIEITIKSDYFTVKDFGTGISDEMMGERYGKYGGSTKKNDGKQTGGFGLGCKAPFAYTEHFEVISCHEGVKTIYAMSKSAAEVGGKPSITTLMSMPTTETGLTVKIPVKSFEDTQRFMTYSKAIVFGGEMHAKINGTVAQTMPFSEAGNGFIISHVEMPIINETDARILVRYGNVIYPIPKNEHFNDLFNQVLRTLHNSSGWGATYYGEMIILQAEPNTITVTPSREALSMQPKTIETIKTLLSKYLGQHNPVVMEELTVKGIGESLDSVAHKTPAKLYDHDDGLLGLAHLAKDRKKFITDIKTLVRTRLSHNVRTVSKRGQKDLMQWELQRRLHHIWTHYKKEESGFIQAFAKAHAKGRKLGIGPADWIYQNFFSDFIFAAKQSKILGTFYSFGHSNRYASSGLITMSTFLEKFDDWRSCVQFLNKTVVLATNVLKTEKRLANIPIEYLPEAHKETKCGYLVLIVHNKTKEVEKARAMLAGQNCYVIDMIDHMEWEDPPAPKKPKKVVKRLSGYVRADSAMYKGENFSVSATYADNAPRIDKPEFFVRINNRMDSIGSLDGYLSNKDALRGLKLFGHRGAVVRTSTAGANMIKNLKVEVFDRFVMKEVAKYVSTEPRFLEYWAYAFSRLGLTSSTPAIAFISLVFRNEMFRTHFRLKNNLNETDLIYLKMWLEFKERIHHPWFKEGRDACDVINAIPMAGAALATSEKIRDNLLLNLLDADAVEEILKGNPQDPLVDKTKKIVLSILKG